MIECEFSSEFFWKRADSMLVGARMTRPSIERSIHVFLVALVLTFIWTVTKVAALLGLF